MHRHLPHTNRSVSILGTGSYVPEHIMTNADLEQMVETNDEWIRSRTGIRERRIAAHHETTSDMAAAAASAALENAGIKAEEVDMIICATVTPDMFFPNTACFVQTKINAHEAVCFDVSAACSGFLYAMEIARQFIATGSYETILVIGADKLSGIVNWEDRNTCVLFGDGAGAAILRHREDGRGIITTPMGSDGRLAEILYIPGGGSACPMTAENISQKLSTIRMNGRETYKQAVKSMVDASQQALSDAGVTIDDIACIIPHQANLRIIEAIAERLKTPLDKFHVNLDRYGNTSAAAVAIALDEAARQGRFQRGDLILLVVFGGGLTWASSLIEW
ncbi:MAG: 3-oxoacyl-ACP synthase [Verrucomicrobia bacterium RIFCSPHIGHO2_12_FULL_41_10]|nr:MAG: 3-oxoacyl-ACP synthase [Verrucomicrobia bacterium RIFCSPHIGHO2_12_FULL_41_10]HLB34552.1 beta-ketoacyl-ACP synthase III [Chthoniobacterales bacterium]